MLLRALVDENGATREVRIARSSGFELLDAAASHAVRRWAFVPAREAGHTVAAWVQVPVTFELR